KNFRNSARRSGALSRSPTTWKTTSRPKRRILRISRTTWTRRRRRPSRAPLSTKPSLPWQRPTRHRSNFVFAKNSIRFSRNSRESSGRRDETTSTSLGHRRVGNPRSPEGYDPSPRRRGPAHGSALFHRRKPVDRTHRRTSPCRDLGNHRHHAPPDIESRVPIVGGAASDRRFRPPFLPNRPAGRSFVSSPAPAPFLWRANEGKALSEGPFTDRVAFLLE